MSVINAILETFAQSGFTSLPWQNWVMILVSFVLFYLAIVKKFEPLLLIPIAFGMMLVNVYPDIMADPLMMSSYEGEVVEGAHWYDAGVLRLIYAGVKSSIFPCLIFMGVGAMTDFGPLLANPSSLLLGAAAQLGIYVAFLIAMATGFIPGFDGFTPQEAASIAIIGGADGPTAIYLTGKLAPQLLGPIAVAAYSYMALIPLIQPPIMKALTTKKEREIKMNQLRTVSKAEKIIFPIVVTALCALLIPSTAPLIGMLMLGNLFKESGLTDRLSDTAQNALCNIITIMLGVTVGATANGKTFLDVKTLLVIAIGLIAFCFSTAGGVLFAKLMNVITKGKVNPLIGSAGVSAVPMAARVSQVEGRKYNPSNFLLMHAMGPNVAGVIGSAVAAGFLLMTFGGK
ncbi:MAG: sodium ion-translocating decarboxylase subunit beta [Clostridia bacterium]|nr:sodium ion-translocating decarboxylase subunit beta [Clostridia bacterium]HAQ63798.1 glutaconyl-CoA decarboxylase subunit beta [Oscillospiraceae bacterium]